MRRVTIEVRVIQAIFSCKLSLSSFEWLKNDGWARNIVCV